MFLNLLTNILTLVSGADARMAQYTKEGKTSLTTIGLNILIISLLTGSSVFFFIKLVPVTQPLLLLVGSLTGAILSIIVARKVLFFLIPKLRDALVSATLTFGAFILALIISFPFEVTLIKLAEPGHEIMSNKLVFFQVEDWIKATNGVQTLIFLRWALRICCLTVFALPFFVGWKSRNGIYFQVINARKSLNKIIGHTV